MSEPEARSRAMARFDATDRIPRQPGTSARRNPPRGRCLCISRVVNHLRRRSRPLHRSRAMPRFARDVSVPAQWHTPPPDARLRILHGRELYWYRSIESSPEWFSIGRRAGSREVSGNYALPGNSLWHRLRFSPSHQTGPGDPPMVNPERSPSFDARECSATRLCYIPAAHGKSE